MSVNYLTEAFKQLDLLEGRSFSFNEEGAAKMANFLEDDVLDDFETIIDPEAESEDELKPTYVGDVILGCETCHSMIYKAADDVVVDEETQLANVGEFCPYCFTTDGFKLIGKVAPFEEVSVDVASNEDDNLDEPSDTDTTNAQNVGTDSEEEPINEFLPVGAGLALGGTALGAGIATSGVAKAVGKLFDDYDVDENSSRVTGGRKLKEGMENISITTDNEVITVNSTVRPEKEEIAPLTDEEIEEIVAPQEETEMEGTEMVEAPVKEDETVEEPVEEVEIEEIDEEGFDNLGESYLKKVYENVESFKTVAGKRSNGKIILEGVIKFNSGKKAKTSFIFESKELTKRGKLRLFGENVNIATSKGAFILTGKTEGKKLICEAFTYNYNAKDAKTGLSKKLYGTVRK